MSAQIDTKVKKFSVISWGLKKKRKQPISMMTAYDYPSAKYVDEAGIDAILVGDSVNMVVLGQESTVTLAIDEIIHHCKAVAAGANRSFLVGDMPFMTYQADPIEAVKNAGRLLKEGGMDAVKLEGGKRIAPTVEKIVAAGIPVMGHIGLTPQSISQLGGYRIQGKKATDALNLLEDAMALQAAGCFSIVLESVPTIVANEISKRLSIPTIGIGAGSGCDGQVLVYHDVLGVFDDFTPRFVKKYAELKPIIIKALKAYNEDVSNRAFPAQEHTYSMKEEEKKRFIEGLQKLDTV
ncbi:MAG: 3-methyl-2-oxobutanoate hydroxymethyltransferase [Chloroflexota bacterium]